MVGEGERSLAESENPCCASEYPFVVVAASQGDVGEDNLAWSCRCIQGHVVGGQFSECEGSVSVIHLQQKREMAVALLSK